MNATHDDDDAFHLFGAPPAVASPDAFELFPTAPAAASATSTVDDVSERVATLALKPAPMLELRAMAPPSDADGGDDDDAFELFPTAPPAASTVDDVTDRVATLALKPAPWLEVRAMAPPIEADEGDEDGGFDLFPTTAPATALVGSDSTAATDLSGNHRSSRSTSATAAAAAANVAAFSRVRSLSAVVANTSGTNGAPLSPVHKMSGNAVDIIAVRSTEDQYFTTPWHVSFGGLTPPVGDLLFADLSDERPNHVRFEHYQKATDTFRYVESRLHVWGPNESVVVADLDGTLTISDVEGHIRTLRLGQYDFLHKGACDFFMKLHELGLRIVYLTARPIDWATASRTHLENATQQAHALPPGPLITNSNGLTGALLTEVVNKNPHVFKAQVLNEIQLTLIHAGRVTEHPVFVAGFGNRPTDIVAYETVGMDPALIFMLDPYSNLKASSDPRVYESYADPNALLWLLPRLKHRVPMEKVARIDDYTVRELVLAEDREQLLMAERLARALQEEEYARARGGGAAGASGGGSVLTRALYGS
ncbi:hypothetical protein PybrP1_001578 [[Pythium] brassicae (nom. inval.)]|nr:hypothetical protein PybrP1_001578 [[Pythium] brassicae (nom. inval.)]